MEVKSTCEACGKDVFLVSHNGILKGCDTEVNHPMGCRVERFIPHSCRVVDVEEFAKSEQEGVKRK